MAELKYQAVGDYLSGKGSLQVISKKYGLRDTKQLQNWIKMYNGHTELKSYTGGSRMTKGRSTTYEERIALVKECIKNGYNYGEIAEKHKVGYQQIYTWVKKYKENGESALKDHRGRHKNGEQNSYIIFSVYLTECTSVSAHVMRGPFFCFLCARCINRSESPMCTEF